MNTRQWRLLSVFVLAVVMLLIVAACIQAAPTPAVLDSQAISAQEEFKTIRVKGLSDLRGILTVGGAATFNGSATFAVTPTFSTAATFSGTATFAVTPTMPALTINSVTQSGAIRYGTASNVVSGTLIAHGIGTTPTLFMPMGATAQATTFTQTVYAPASLCNTVSCTIYVSQGSITNFVALEWWAGK